MDGRCLSVCLFFCVGLAAYGAEEPSAPGRDFQWQIVEFFSAERCDLVRESTSASMYSHLRPNVRAIVAFCEPRDADHEALFASAERDDPTGDLIAVLHAKYVWKRDRERARPLWEKALKLARNGYLRSMAKRYLSDEVEKDEILHLNATSFQARLRVGGGYESNPTLPLAPEPTERRPQSYGTAALGATVQRWLSFGSISATYSGTYDRFTDTPSLSYLDNLLELPVSLRLGTNEDLVFRPFGGVARAGSRQYGTRYGLGVMGVAYRPEYKQSVQGSVFTENLLLPALAFEEGTHFRFDYNWEFFPRQWIYRFQASMEHVRATNDFNNGTDLKFSHTTVGGQFQAQYLARGITYEGTVQANMRLDSLPSEYLARDSGRRIRKRRNDFTLLLRPGVSVPLWRDVDLGTFYELRRTFSPMGANDFANYNVLDHSVELTLTTELSNY